VEDDPGVVLQHHLAHARGVLAVGQHGGDVAEVARLLELAADLEQVALGVVDQHQQRGTHACDLA
jgi:predicted LPLAT superfamily acyltransferase